MTMTVADLAWAAGLIDGEGCFSVGASPTRSSISTRLRLRVVLSELPSNLDALRKLQSMFGGTIRSRPRQKSWRTGARDQWEWCLSGDRSVDAAALLSRYLVIKKQTARLYLQIATLRKLPVVDLRELLTLRDQLNYRPATRHPNYLTAEVLLKGRAIQCPRSIGM
jgi:hypothetical protein